MNLNNNPHLSNPRFSTQVSITVPFHDVDAMGVVWHGNYFRYFEVAREALLNQFDYSYRQMKESGYAWPIVDTRVKYISSVDFEDQITVRAQLVEYENRLKIEYKIFDKNGKRVTTGYTIQVAVDMNTREMCFVSPQVFLQKLGIQQSSDIKPLSEVRP